MITALVASLRRLLPFSRCVMALCAICAGVFLTWTWLLVAMFIGYSIDVRIPAILMGGSIVGIAYQAGRFLPITRSELLWKALFIPVGFALVFTVLDRAWSMMSITLLAIASIVIWFFIPWITPLRSAHVGRVESLKEKMKQCC